MKRISTILILLLLALSARISAEISLSVKVPPRVYEGDKFPITLHITDADNVSDASMSQIDGCKFLNGPAKSTSRSYSVINGRAESSSSIDLTYYYRADKAGRVTIPAASVVADGKRLTAKSTTLTILPRADQDKPASQRPVEMDDPDTQAAGRRVASDDVFVRIILSKNSAYEQEAISCTIKLYTKYSISSFLPTKQPSFDGFLIQEMDVQPALNEVEVYNGHEYMTAILKRCIIFPQKSGKLTISSGNYDISVVQYANVNMGMFQVRQPREAKIKVSSNTGSINILPLPTPQPEGFNGAVGNFTVDARIVGNSFRTNDPSTLIYTVNGTGNIKYLKEPEIDFPSEFELYTPKSNFDTRVVGNDVTGSMTVEYTFVPQSIGEFTVGSNKFVYFNPDTKQYVTLNTPSFPVKVAKGLSSPSPTAEQSAIENKNSDIRHIFTGPKTATDDLTPNILEGWYWLIYAVLFLLCGGYAVINRRNARRHADIVGMKTAKAKKVAAKRLKQAKQFLASGNADKFHEEMLRAIWGYLSDKLNIPVSQLSRQNIVETLSEKGYPEAETNAIVSVLDECEMARYTPESSSRMDALYQQGVSAIDNLENSLRK